MLPPLQLMLLSRPSRNQAISFCRQSSVEHTLPEFMQSNNKQ